MTAGPLALVLHGAASLRGLFPLSLVLPLPGSVTFLALVPHLEALLESLALSIPRSFLVVALSAPAVGFAVALWLWPERALSRFSLRQAPWSILSLVALLHRVFAAGFRHWCTFRLCGGAFSPCVWFHRGPWGVAVAPPMSPYTGPGWSPPFCHVALELRSVFPIFPVRLSAHLNGALFVSFPDSCVSIPHFYLGCSSLDSCLDEWLGGLCPPPLSSRILSFEWSYSPDSLILLHPAIDFVAVSLSPSLMYALPHGHCVPLGGLHVLVGSSTYPSLGCLLGPSSIGLWLCWRLCCRPVPSSCFLDSVSYLACSLDCCSYGFLRWT